MEKKEKTHDTGRNDRNYNSWLNLFLEYYLDHKVNNLIGCQLTFKGIQFRSRPSRCGYTILN